MNKTYYMTALAFVAAASVLLAASSADWPDMNDQTALQNATTPEPKNPGDTFVIPPTPGTDAHDKWIEWYRTAEFDGLDAHTRDAVLILHDFEVMFSPDMEHDASLEVVALLAQKDRLGNGYNPTTNERFLHNWVIQQYSPPYTTHQIDDRILSIVQAPDNIYHAENIYHTMNDMANIGYVPDDLWKQDWEYWHWERHIAACDPVWEECDPVQLRKDLANNRELTAEEITEIEK